MVESDEDGGREMRWQSCQNGYGHLQAAGRPAHHDDVSHRGAPARLARDGCWRMGTTPDLSGQDMRDRVRRVSAVSWDMGT